MYIHWLGFLLGQYCKYSLSLPRCKCWLPYAPSLLPIIIGSPVVNSLCGKTKWAFWKVTHMLEELDIHLGLFIATRKKYRPTWALSVAVLCQPGGETMWSECSCSCHPSSAVFFGLCGTGGASTSPLRSSIFIVMSCLWIVASWSSCEEDWSQHQHIVPS